MSLAENKKRSNKADILKKVRPQEALNMIKSIGLRKRYENILIMRYVDDMSCMDIADELHVEVETARNSVYMARKQFDKYFVEVNKE